MRSHSAMGVLRVVHTHEDYQADITSNESLEQLVEPVAPFDAIACAAGDAGFRP